MGITPRNQTQLRNLWMFFIQIKLGFNSYDSNSETFAPLLTDGDGKEFLKLCVDTTKEIRFLQEDYTVADISELLKSTPMLEIFEIPGRLQSQSGNVVKLFPDSLENSKSKLTHLKTLIFPSENLEERNKFCPTFLEELITPAQNISSLDMSYSSSSFEVLSLIEKLGREASIQELEISVDGHEHDDISNLLLRMTAKPNGLKLKSFQCDSALNDLVLQLIQSFKETLEYFHLSTFVCQSFTEFPKMSRLKRLTLAWFPEDFEFRCINLNEIFPVLFELTVLVWQDEAEATEEFFSDSAPCPNMKSFQLGNSACMTINAFNQMLNVFPNLTGLSIDIRVDGVEILRRIWSQMTRLEYLYICGRIQTTDAVDSILTGIPVHALQEMRDIINNLDKIPLELERREIILKLRNQYSQLPSITHLTSLSELSIDLIGDGVKVKSNQRNLLTDLSGYLGFYSMKRLRKLKVKSCKMTKKCCEILTKDMGLESWEFKTSKYKDIIPSEKNN